MVGIDKNQVIFARHNINDLKLKQILYIRHSMNTLIVCQFCFLRNEKEYIKTYYEHANDGAREEGKGDQVPLA